MKQKLKLSTFQIGAPAKRGEGLRIGVTRRPPRGVPKSRWVRDGYFDVWFPALAPSTKLLARFKKHRFTEDPAADRAFFDSYERELLATAESRQTVKFVAQVAARTSHHFRLFLWRRVAMPPFAPDQDHPRARTTRVIELSRVP
jgi:uncharacterized protein YeaO (DUF488 family)